MRKRRPYETQFLVYREGEPVTVDILYDMDPYVPAQTQGDPLDCWPEEGGVAWNMIVEKEGEPFELTPLEEEEFITMIQEEQLTCR